MTSVSVRRSKEINSLEELHYEFGRITLLFNGKETDDNWELRVAFFKKVTTLLLSEKAVAWREHIDKGIHNNMSALILSIHSNRSTVAAEALSFVDGIASSVASSMSIYTLEIIMKNLLKISCITKKALAAKVLKVTNHLLSKTSFHTKIISMLCKTGNEKNPQLREFSAFYIQTVLDTHGSSEAVKSRIAKADLNQLIKDFIQKGLVDATPSVREACKSTYSVYSKYWPKAAETLFQQMDLAVQRRLGVKPSTSVTKATKPMINRTIKSVGSIQKPGSRVIMTKSNSYCNKNSIASTTVKAIKPRSSLPTAASSMPKISMKAERPPLERRSRLKPSTPFISNFTKPAINRTMKSGSSIFRPFNETAATQANLAIVRRAAVETANARSSCSSTVSSANKSMLATSTTTQNPTREKLAAETLTARRQLGVRPATLSKPDSTRPAINRTVKCESSIAKSSSRLFITKANSDKIQDAIASTSVKPTKSSSSFKPISNTKGVYRRLGVNPFTSSSNRIPNFAKPTIGQTMKSAKIAKPSSSTTKDGIASATAKSPLGPKVCLTTLPTPTSSVSPTASPSISGSAQTSSALPPSLPSTSTPPT
ncbi:clasp N terminal-domain-containing protein [Parasitella parasitica]|nr:clasp N terminal-domain-containing protein [Parasitella parasitica]